MKTITATYDGEVLRPHNKLDLPAGKRVKITIQSTKGEPYSSLQVLREARLEGPSDASVRVNDPSYRLGERDDG